MSFTSLSGSDLLLMVSSFGDVNSDETGSINFFSYSTDEHKFNELVGAVQSVNFPTNFQFGFSSQMQNGNMLVTTQSDDEASNWDFNVFSM